MLLHLHYRLATAVTPSPNVAAVAGMFGLGIDRRREIELIPPTTLELHAHQVVFITGSSGGGKTTLLRLIEQAARQHESAPTILRFEALDDPPDVPLVDGFGDLPLEQTLRLLSLAGLNDTPVMLRRPRELSDGQRYRLRLAQAMARVEALNHVVMKSPRTTSARKSEPGAAPTLRAGDSQDQPEAPTALILADEFGATLDRLTAQVLARNVRKWVDRLPVCFIAATTHDDLLEPLSPDVLIEKRLGRHLEIAAKEGAANASE